MMRIPLLLIGATALAFIQAVAPQVELHSVEGVITEAGGAKPIPGVQVALNCQPTRFRDALFRKQVWSYRKVAAAEFNRLVVGKLVQE